MAMHGTVIRSTGSWYVVRTDDGHEVECKVKGNFRLRGIRSTSPVAVGDGVGGVLEDSLPFRIQGDVRVHRDGEIELMLE